MIRGDAAHLPRYIEWIGAERLRVMGCSLETLLGELDAVPFSAQYLLSDLVRMSYGCVQTRRGRVWQHYA